MPLSEKKSWLRKPTVLAVVAGVFLLAGVAGAVHTLLDWQVLNSIRQNAEVRALTWSARLFENVPNAEKMFEEGAVADDDILRLVDSFAMTDIVRFELFDVHGHRTFMVGDLNVDHGEVINQNALNAFQTGKPKLIVVHDEEAEEARGPDTFVEAYVPAIAPSGQRVGTIELYVDVSPLEDALESAFQQISWLLIIGTAIVLAIPAGAYVHRTKQLRKQDQKLLELTRYDQLTGILNRNSVSEILARLFKEQAGARGLGVLFVDVDYFKQVNDQYGHACGDRLLKHIADILCDSTRRGTDIVGRFGGDEFVVLAPGISRDEFRKLYGRVMEGAKTPCSHEDKSYTPSLSVGAYLTREGDTEKAALHRADLAVYAAKRRGRGQVAEFSEELEGLFKQDAVRQTA
ncbi:GGDEF domain-containing protein [Roseibium sp. Sym1]|uniref:GGDEF domain-containing protein n=1 Tax=Roseibium sp. Sym1 TaxID=3016006 RepID=UPI0022B4E6C9|nr:GGDEF domain-containing protein [Roseibium sp. Sym1]